MELTQIEKYLIHLSALHWACSFGIEIAGYLCDIVLEQLSVHQEETPALAFQEIY